MAIIQITPRSDLTRFQADQLRRAIQDLWQYADPSTGGLQCVSSGNFLYVCASSGMSTTEGRAKRVPSRAFRLEIKGGDDEQVRADWMFELRVLARSELVEAVTVDGDRL